MVSKDVILIGSVAALGIVGFLFVKKQLSGFKDTLSGVKDFFGEGLGNLAASTAKGLSDLQQDTSAQFLRQGIQTADALRGVTGFFGKTIFDASQDSRRREKAAAQPISFVLPPVSNPRLQQAISPEFFNIRDIIGKKNPTLTESVILRKAFTKNPSLLLFDQTLRGTRPISGGRSVLSGRSGFAGQRETIQSVLRLQNQIRNRQDFSQTVPRDVLERAFAASRKAANAEQDRLRRTLGDDIFSPSGFNFSLAASRGFGNLI